MFRTIILTCAVLLNAATGFSHPGIMPLPAEHVSRPQAGPQGQPVQKDAEPIPDHNQLKIEVAPISDGKVSHSPETSSVPDPATQKTQPLAVVSFILGLLSCGIVPLFILGGLPLWISISLAILMAKLGLGMGMVALRKIKQSKGLFSGKELAMMGIGFSSIPLLGALFLCGLIIYFIIRLSSYVDGN